jgi:multidrug efflux pump subunit AcrA (membrane-fusion protein)
MSNQTVTIKREDASAAAPMVKPDTSASKDVPAAILELLRLEGEMRSVTTTHELAMLAANDVRKVTRARQIFVLKPAFSGHLQVCSVTGLPDIDRSVPLIQLLEGIAARLKVQRDAAKVLRFQLADFADAADKTLLTYPMPNALWVPVTFRDGKLAAALLMARDEPWAQNDEAIAVRLSLALSQAWYWLSTSKQRRWWLPKFNIKTAAITAAALVAIGLLPVSLATIAPVMLAPRDHLVVTAPIDGIIGEIPVASNEAVSPGQLLVQFEDTALRSNLSVAEREVGVAEARVKKTMLQAVNDIGGRHELAIAKSELEVKTAERDFARDVLARSRIEAPEAGIVILGDKRDLLGKPVSTGEKILELANPDKVELHVDVPVSDALILKPGARVQAFLDSDPLNPLEAKIVRADYQAKVREAGTLSFRVVAELTETPSAPPRLGTRGTAQLFGDRVPLAYYIFRRPLTVLRQWTGL